MEISTEITAPIDPRLDFSKLEVGDIMYNNGQSSIFYVIKEIKESIFTADQHQINDFSLYASNHRNYIASLTRDKYFFVKDPELLGVLKALTEIRTAGKSTTIKLIKDAEQYLKDLAEFNSFGLKEKFLAVIKHHFDSSNYELLMVGDFLEMTFKFNDVTIENSNGLNHFIKSMFIKLKYNINTHVFLTNMLGGRGYMSVKESIKEYTHSHLPSGSTSFGSNYCLGSSEIQDILHDLNVKKYDANRFDLLLYNLKEYIKWESLEGGPHFKIENLNYGSNDSNRVSTPSATILQDIYNRFIYNKLSFNTIFNFSSNKIEVVEDELFINNVLAMSPGALKGFDIGGVLRNSTSNKELIERAKSKMANFRKFNFKGETYPQLYIEEALNETVAHTLQAHPLINKTIKEKLELKINTHFLNTL